MYSRWLKEHPAIDYRLAVAWPVSEQGVESAGFHPRSGYHPTARFASVILNGACRQYSGHPAGLAGAAQTDPKQPFVEAEHSDARLRKRAYGAPGSIDSDRRGAKTVNSRGCRIPATAR